MKTGSKYTVVFYIGCDANIRKPCIGLGYISIVRCVYLKMHLDVVASAGAFQNFNNHSSTCPKEYGMPFAFDL